MAIILEGFDGSGKSTLAAKLGLPILHAGGPPKDAVQLQMNLSEQLENCIHPVILDRVSCISHQVYGGHLFEDRLMMYLHAMLKTPKVVLVYCRPPLEILVDFSNHEVKDHDTPEHLADIEANKLVYINRYDLLMANVTHVKYDFTVHGNNQEFINGLIYSQRKV